jgi:hypothetical protein
MDKIDQGLARALDEAINRHGGKNAVIQRRLQDKLPTITPQGIGLYRRGKRTIPLKFIQAWREEFKEDLEKLAENVSHETKSKQCSKTMDMDVWEFIKGTNEVIKSSNQILQLEFERLWALVEKYSPPAPPLMTKDPVVKNGNH